MTDEIKRLTGLEASRGIAALLVTIYHATLHVNENRGGSQIGGLFLFGHSGVDFFFVLSGFIIAHVHWRDANHPERIRNYVTRRFIRVYPLYWLVTLFYLCVSFFLHRERFPRVPEILSSTFLLPQAAEPIVGVAWTLVYEVLFYFIFALLLLWKPLGLLVMVLWVGIISASIFASVHVSGALLQSLASPFCLQFFMGMVAARLFASQRVSRPRALIFIGVIGFLVSASSEVLGHLNGYGTVARLCYGMSAAFFVLGLSVLEVESQLGGIAPLLTLGSASYSLYLVHGIAIGVAYRSVEYSFGLDALSKEMLWVILVITAVVVGILTSRFVEYPLLRVTRRYFR